MINKLILAILIFLTYKNISIAQEKRIVIEIEVPARYKPDSIKLGFLNIYGYESGWEELQKRKIQNGSVKFSILSEKRLYINADILGKGDFLGEPGDSIHIKKQNDSLLFSGRGYEKWQIVKEANQFNEMVGRPMGGISKSSQPLRDYLAYSQNTKALVNKKLTLLENYKDQLSSFAYLYLKSCFTFKHESKLLSDFDHLMVNREKIGLSKASLMKIWDSTLRNSMFYQLSLHKSDTACLANDLAGFLSNYGWWAMSYETNFENMNSGSLPPRDIMIQNMIQIYTYEKNMYTGLARQKALIFLIKYLIKYYGFSKEINATINDFMAIPNYPQFKEWLKTYTAKQQLTAEGKPAPDFVLTGTNGKKVSLSDLKGRLVFVDFWFTGCKGCVEMAKVMSKVEKEFYDNPNIAFLSISTDTNKQQWLNSIIKKKYTTGTGVNVYTNGLGQDHPITKAYNIFSYPSVFLIDYNGLFQQVTDPRGDNGKQLTAILKQKIAALYDGPYVLYKGDKAASYSFAPDAKGKPVLKKVGMPLKAVTHAYDQPLTIRLKKSLQPEPTIYSKPPKLIALSDIEGNFDALRKLLQNNGVIDNNYNWTFGNGHLVCNGDFFDRGDQVTECLWLIYSLEEQAKAKGGYVHFILGNHEIMNLNGNTRYTQMKYQGNATLLNLKYKDAWGNNNELGRWLRSKNVIEKIGDYLFIHGGISAYFNNLPLTLQQMNETIRPILDKEDSARSLSDKRPQMFFKSGFSPFWYRGYYAPNEKDKATLSQIDSTLKKFNVSHIITGHTIVGDTISVHYKGKVINTDTHHAEGKSEALLVEGSDFFRVNDKGEKVLLFTDDKKRTQ